MQSIKLQSFTETLKVRCFVSILCLGVTILACSIVELDTDIIHRLSCKCDDP
jgi:hypothetical protein